MAKVLVSLEDELLKHVDRVARSRGVSRSAYLAELAERDVRIRAAGLSAATRRALSRLDELFASNPAGDSTAAVRSERDAR